MATAFKMDGGWARWKRAVTPAVFKAKLDTKMRAATAYNGKLAELAIRKAIKRGMPPPNAALTTFIKSSSKPLVDQGGLFQAVTSVVMDQMTVFVGILYTSGEYNIALALHEGVTIRVTPAMRGMFLYLYKASIGEIDPSKLTGRAAELWERKQGGWLPLGETTSNIVIPGRPFIEQAFQDDELKVKATETWQRAIEATLRELALGG